MDGWIWGLLIAAALGFIPANIAKKKGHSFGLWWLYGWLLFIVAIIHVQFIEDISGNGSNIPLPRTNAQSAADELRKYKDLLDQGALTEEEYNAKKNKESKIWNTYSQIFQVEIPKHIAKMCEQPSTNYKKDTNILFSQEH